MSSDLTLAGALAGALAGTLGLFCLCFGFEFALGVSRPGQWLGHWGCFACVSGLTLPLGSPGQDFLNVLACPHS